jgi:tight adherence protein B
MFLLGTVFLIILLIAFSVVTFMMRETHEQKMTRSRFAAIAEPLTTRHSSNIPPELYLTVTDPGPFGWLEVLLEGRPVLIRLKLLLIQSDTEVAPGSVIMASFALAAITLLAVNLLTSLTVAAVVTGIIAAYLPYAFLRFRRSRRLAAFDAALPECIDMCTRALRAGHSMISAFGILADQAIEPVKTEFSEVYKKQNYGLPLRDAMLQMLERVPSPDLRVFITGILVQKDTGGNLADFLDRIVTMIRERIRIQREIRTQTAQGRLTGWILCLLPFVMLILLNIVTPGYSDVLFHDPLGQKMLYIGFGLLLTGGFFIRQIVNGIEV